MRHGLTTLLLAAALLSACRPAASTGDAATPATVAPTATTPATTAPQAEVPAPEAATVLRDLFGETIADADQVKLPDGRYASDWRGQTFTLDGRRYHVGFAEYTDAAENEYPAEGDTVSIGQVTYALDAGAWKRISVREGIGRFGAYNKPPQLDEATPTQQAVIDGRYLLAVPTVETAMAGARLTFFELFAFTPGDVSWIYLGFVPGGRDTRAGCTADAAPQPVVCVASRATLRFATPAQGDVWPALTVALDGEVVGDDGKPRAATDADAVRYRYDATSGRYVRVMD